jgi:hypothetical protein
LGFVARLWAMVGTSGSGALGSSHPKLSARAPERETGRLLRGPGGFGLDSFVLRDFWATEASLAVTMIRYSLMGVFPRAVLRKKASPHAVNVAPPGLGRGSDVGRQHKKHQAYVSSGGGTKTKAVVLGFVGQCRGTRQTHASFFKFLTSNFDK